MNHQAQMPSETREESGSISQRARASNPAVSVSERSPAPQAAQPDIQLHIENLVLDGFDSLDRNSLVSSVERELARLLAADGVVGMDANVSHLDAGEFRIASRTRSEIIGIHIAECVHRGLRRESRSET